MYRAALVIHADLCFAFCIDVGRRTVDVRWSLCPHLHSHLWQHTRLLSGTTTKRSFLTGG